MSLLSVYKNGLIVARTNLYKANLATLMSYYQGLIDAIKGNIVYSRKVKIIKNNALLRARYSASVALRKAYTTDVARIIRISALPLAPPVIRTTPLKSALMVGINYIGTNNRLNGCINDAILMSSLVKGKYGYKSEDVSLMTDLTLIKPTSANIITGFTNLLKNAQSGDNLFFFYSGHGTRTFKQNLLQIDNTNECIFALDGINITDITFKRIIDANMKDGVHLVCVFDSCFSGTVMNLAHNYLNSDNGGGTWINTEDTLVTHGTVICISGSTDSQTSEDAFINGKYEGALTWALNTALTTDLPSNLDDPIPAPSYSQGAASWSQLITNVRALLLHETYTQLPQLSSGNVLDIDGPVLF